MTILTFLILSLAAYRINHLIVFDKIFEPIRNLFVTRNFKGPIPTFKPQGGSVRRFIGRIMNCFWCAGLWVSFLVTLVFYPFQSVTELISIALAIAAVISLIETYWVNIVGFPAEMMEAKDDHG